MSLARKLALRDQYTAPPSRAPSRVPLSATSARLPLPAPPTTLAPAAASTTITVEGRPVKRLTQAEQEERRWLGLCYNCDEKFGRGHNRVCKRLFLLEGAVEEDSTLGEEDATGEAAPHDCLRQAHDVDPALLALRDEISAGQHGAPWTVIDNMIAYAGRLYVAPAARVGGRRPRGRP